MASKHKILRGRGLGGLMGCESSVSVFLCVFLYVFNLKGLTPHLAACTPSYVTCQCHQLLPCPHCIANHLLPAKESGIQPFQEKVKGGWWGKVGQCCGGLTRAGLAKRLEALVSGGLWSLTQNAWPHNVFRKLLQHKTCEQEWLIQVLFVSRSRKCPCLCVCSVCVSV